MTALSQITMTSTCLKRSSLLQNFINCNKASKPVLQPTDISWRNIRDLNGITIDPKDVNHLSKFANDWWNPQGSVIALHSLNFLRVPLIRDSLINWTPGRPQSTCLKGKKILEVGCAAGILTEDLAKLGAELTAIDPSEELLNAAVEHSTFNTTLISKPTYINTTIEEFCKENSDKYDAVVASEVIDHVNTAQRELFIESCVKAVKPGGKIIVTGPNRTRVSEFFLGFLLEALKFVPKGTHNYHKCTTPEELRYWLELNDCRVDLTQGYFYYFWSNKWVWTKSQAIMYAMRGVKLSKIT